MNRNLSLDFAKGIGIILVVLGHCMSAKTPPGIFIYAFHMPLFFVISGLCFNPQRYPHFMPFFLKRMRQLLLPAYAFSLLIIALSKLLIHNTSSDFSMLWQQGFPCAIWFLGVLFMVEMLYWGVYKMFKGKALYLMISALFSLIVGGQFQGLIFGCHIV